MLVDHRGPQQALAGRDLIRCLGVEPGPPKATMWLDWMLAPADAGHDHAAPVRLQDGVGHRGAGEDGGQLELVAAGHEDAGGLAEPLHELLVVGLLAGLRAHRDHLGGTELAEQRVVHAHDLGPQRRRRRDDRDAGVGPPLAATNS